MDGVTVTEKAVKARKPKRMNSYWRKLCLPVAYDFTGLRTVNQGNNERLWMWQKRCVCEEFQQMGPGEIQELTDTMQEELTKDLRETSASEPVPDHEEVDVEAAAPEDKSTFDNVAEGFRLFKTFYDTSTETKADGGRSLHTK